MAAGLGFKTFTTGEVLTAADTNGYLMQGVNVFANAAARTAAITSPQEGQMSYLKDTNSTEYYSGSAWVAVGGSTSGMTLIKRAAFSNVAGTGTTFDDTISTTYETFIVVIERIWSEGTDSDDLQFQFRYAGPTTQAAGYFGQNFGAAYNVTSLTFNAQSNLNQFTMATQIGTAAYASAATLIINGAETDQERPRFYGSGVQGSNHLGTSTFAGIQDTARTYTGLLFKTSSGNITGEIAIYGLAKA